jgi:hypothetical protein
VPSWKRPRYGTTSTKHKFTVARSASLCDIARLISAMR